MSTSTVSRTIQNKYIQYRGRIVPLRSFFTTAIRSDASVSSQAVRQRIQDLIKTENPEAPLSDESVRIALSALGIEVSRRAVAKYRMALDIPPSSQRKKTLRQQWAYASLPMKLCRKHTAEMSFLSR